MAAPTHDRGPTGLRPTALPLDRTGLHRGVVDATPGPIVVGYDGTPDADGALDWAVRTATLTARRLEVVIVGSDMDPVVGHFREQHDRLVSAWQQGARSRLDGAGVASWDVAVRRGPAVPVLLAAGAGAGLLVVGSRGHGLVLGSLTGSVSQHVARHATCPVVVVRPPAQPDAQQIVVGVDGSDGARAALRFACARAVDTGEPVVVVHAYRASGGTAQAERLLAEVAGAALADCPGIDLTTMAVAAPADRVLSDLGAGSSLVVVGSRGRDAFTELLLGSVAQEVLRRAGCPVAVVR